MRNQSLSGTLPRDLALRAKPSALSASARPMPIQVSLPASAARVADLPPDQLASHLAMLQTSPDSPTLRSAANSANGACRTPPNPTRMSMSKSAAHERACSTDSRWLTPVYGPSKDNPPARVCHGERRRARAFDEQCSMHNGRPVLCSNGLTHHGRATSIVVAMRV